MSEEVRRGERTAFKAKLNGSQDWSSFSVKFVEYASQYPYMREEALLREKCPDFRVLERTYLDQLQQELVGLDARTRSKGKAEAQASSAGITLEELARQSSLVKFSGIHSDIAAIRRIWKSDCTRVLGVLFESLSSGQEYLVSIWAKIVKIYSAGEVIFLNYGKWMHWLFASEEKKRPGISGIGCLVNSRSRIST